MHQGIKVDKIDTGDEGALLFSVSIFHDKRAALKAARAEAARNPSSADPDAASYEHVLGQLIDNALQPYTDK